MHAPFTCTQVGMVIPVVLTVTDAAGNIDMDTTMVSVFDDVMPTLGISVSPTFLDSSGVYMVDENDLVGMTNDDCTAVSDLVWAFDPPSLDCDDVGIATPVSVTVSDESNNSAIGIAMITVEDNIAPIAECYDSLTLILDAFGTATLTTMMVDSASTDNCAVSNLSLSQTIFGCGDVNTTTSVTLTVSDANGNSSSCSTVISVMDTIPPVAMCEDITINYTDPALIPGDVTTQISDNCALMTTQLSQTTFDCTELGTNEVTVTVTDVNMLVTTCISMVTVEDNVAPTAMANSVITVELDAAGSATINPFTANNGSSDSCDNSLNFSVSPPTVDCDDLGTVAAMLIVTDDSGNSSSVAFDIMVIDTLAPTVTCQAHTTDIDASGMVTVFPIDFVSTTSDNCMIQNTLINTDELGTYMDSLTFDCLDAAASPIDIWLMVTDTSGNADTCMTTLTLTAATMPVAMAKDITIALDNNGMQTINHTDIDDGSTGLCGVAVSISQTDFDCGDVGVQTVTLTAIDAFGNMDTATAMVTVQDTLDPTIVTNPFNATFASDGTYTLDIADMATFSDNCDKPTISADQTSFDCDDAGLNVITFTVTDASGNTVMAQNNLTILDDEAPSFTVQDINIDLDPITGAAVFGDTLETDFMENFTFATSPLAVGTALISTPANVAAPSLPSNSTPIGATLLFCTNTDNSSCLLYTSPSPRDATLSRMPSSA